MATIIKKHVKIEEENYYTLKKEKEYLEDV
jgi:hypothetical protein